MNYLKHRQIPFLFIFFFILFFCTSLNAGVFSDAKKITFPSDRMVPLKVAFSGNDFFIITLEDKVYTARLDETSLRDSKQLGYLGDSLFPSKDVKRVVTLGNSIFVFYNDIVSATLISFKSTGPAEVRLIENSPSLPMGLKTFSQGASELFIQDLKGITYNGMLTPENPLSTPDSGFLLPLEKGEREIQFSGGTMRFKGSDSKAVKIDFKYNEFMAFSGSENGLVIFNETSIPETRALFFADRDKNLNILEIPDKKRSLITDGLVIKEKAYLFRHFDSALEIDLRSGRIGALKNFIKNTDFTDISVFQAICLKKRICLLTSRGLYLISL